MRIIDHRNTPAHEAVLAKSLAVNLVFSGTIGAIKSVFLRTFDEIVDLRDPANTWVLCSDSMIRVEGYEALSAHLTIEGRL